MDREKIHELTGKPISEPADKPVPSTRSRSGPVVTRRATFHQEEPPLSAAQRDRDREREKIEAISPPTVPPSPQIKI